MPIQRFSKKRQAILDLLQTTDTHPSAETIYTKLKFEIPDLSFGTVYRNLNQLEEAGLVQSVGVVNGQERYDACMAPHSHLFCRRCGAVLDISALSVPREVISAVEAKTGCSVDGASISFSGLCADCRKAEE